LSDSRDFVDVFFQSPQTADTGRSSNQMKKNTNIADDVSQSVIELLNQPPFN